MPKVFFIALTPPGNKLGYVNVWEIAAFSGREEGGSAVVLKNGEVLDVEESVSEIIERMTTGVREYRENIHLPRSAYL